MLTLFTALPMLWRLVSVGALILAIGGTYWGWHHHVDQQGYNRCVAEVVASDAAAVGRVQQGASDIAACRASGKTWDVVTGSCTQ